MSVLGGKEFGDIVHVLPNGPSQREFNANVSLSENLQISPQSVISSYMTNMMTWCWDNTVSSTGKGEEDEHTTGNYIHETDLFRAFCPRIYAARGAINNGQMNKSVR